MATKQTHPKGAGTKKARKELRPVVTTTRLDCYGHTGMFGGI